MALSSTDRACVHVVRQEEMVAILVGGSDLTGEQIYPQVATEVVR